MGEEAGARDKNRITNRVKQREGKQYKVCFRRRNVMGEEDSVSEA